MNNNPPPKQEPSATAREGARAVRDTFVALVDEGFTEQQALVIVGQILAATVGGDS